MQNADYVGNIVAEIGMEYGMTILLQVFHPQNDSGYCPHNMEEFMLQMNKLTARMLLIAVAFILSLVGCSVTEDINTLVQGRQQLSQSSSESPAQPSESTAQPQKLSPIRLYPTVNASMGGPDSVLLEYASENHRLIFDSQVRYLDEHEVTSTNIILPTGHTLYQDETGYFIFSGANVVYVRQDLNADLEDPDNPLYDTRGLLHDSLMLGGDSLYDENGVLVAFDDMSRFTAANTVSLVYNNLILNSYDAFEVLDSNRLSVPLSTLGLQTLGDAQASYQAAQDKVMIRSRPYVPVIQSDAIIIYFNGTDGFLIDVHSFTLPRKQTEERTPGILDYSKLADAASALHTQKLNAMGLAPRFEATDLIAGRAITVYNPYSAKIEEITPIEMDKDGSLSLSLEALRILYGVQLMRDPDTETLHLYTDPYYLSLTEHILGNSQSGSAVRFIGSDSVNEMYAQQQAERQTNRGYLSAVVTKENEPGVPIPIIRTPRSGQFVYPGSSTKIWVSYYKGKGEPVSLRPASGGDWVWNNATGFWEGVSPLSGKKIVWHPSYAAAFTIR